jgi:hypothetical protein
MRVFGSLLAVAVAVLMVAGTSQAAETIRNPDLSTLYLLQRKFAHTAPPYEAMAQWDNAVKSADEFQKPVIAGRIVTALKARNASLDSVKRIVVNLMSTFSEYDTQYQEYNLDISDGTYISYYDGLGGEVRIALTNGTKAQVWKLNPSEAERVLNKNGRGRNTALVLTLFLLPSPPAVDGEPIVLNAKIIGYDVLADHSSARLGSVVVERTP